MRGKAQEKERITKTRNKEKEIGRESKEDRVYSTYIQDPSKHLLNEDCNCKSYRVQASNLKLEHLNLVFSK